MKLASMSKSIRKVSSRTVMCSLICDEKQQINLFSIDLVYCLEGSGLSIQYEVSDDAELNDLSKKFLESIEKATPQEFARTI